MILRFKLYAAAGATAFISSPGGGDAFAVPSAASSSSSSTSRTRRPAFISIASRLASSMNPDWDNDDFLSSLGKDKDAMDISNEKYFKQAESRAAMDEWRARMAPKDGDGGGGEGQQREGGPSPEFFKKMGLSGDVPPPQMGQPRMGQPQTQPPPQMGQPVPQLGQQQAQQMQPPQPQVQQPPPQTGAAPPQQQFFDANGNPVSMPMVYDANGNLVPFVAPQPQQPAQVQQQQGGYVGPAFEPPFPQKTKGTDSPRPVGYNPDAYTMSNTADVYFAQLKQDSKVRKIARMSGDTERANQVFADDSVQKIRDSWVDNPYTKEKNLAEARAEIEGAVRLQVAGDEDGPRASTGISYKKKLEQMKARRAGGGGAQAAAAPTDASAPSVPEQQTKAAATPKLGELIDQQKIIISPPPQGSAPAQTKVISPKASTVELPKVGQATDAMPSPVAPNTATTTAASPSVTDEGDVRGKVRTLQGLLLKHRGGPGFGAGRLKAPEARRLESTLREVKGILRSEVGAGGASNPAPPAAVAKAAPPRQQQPVATAPPPPMMPAKPVVPAPTQAATVVSAAASQTPPDPLAGTVACVEAALKMYKESSPAERDSLIMPLREALMAAASASNKYIAESEADRHRAAMEAGPVATAEAMVSAPPAQPMMGFPTTYAVTKADEEDGPRSSHSAPTAVSSSIDRAENDKKLEDVYNALVNARGDGGKLGLKNISGEEASALAEKLRAMRGVLLDELNSN